VVDTSEPLNTVPLPPVPVPLVPVVLVPLDTELLIVTLSNAVADCPTVLLPDVPVVLLPELVAVITMALAPACVGVPEMVPVAALTLRPNGTPDAL